MHRGLDEWEKQLGQPCTPGGWRQVFMEHPEFFRFHDEPAKTWAAMRWRWALDRDYDPASGRSLSFDELQTASKEQRERLTRPPLTPEQIETLMSTAVKLHATAIERARHARWWIPVVIPAITTIVGILLGAWLKS